MTKSPFNRIKTPFLWTNLPLSGPKLPPSDQISFWADQNSLPVTQSTFTQTKTSYQRPNLFQRTKTQFFRAQMALASLVAISGPKKVSIFKAQPLPMALEMYFPTSNPYVPRYINNIQVHYSYSLKNRSSESLPTVCQLLNLFCSTGVLFFSII